MSLKVRYDKSKMFVFSLRENKKVFWSLLLLNQRKLNVCSDNSLVTLIAQINRFGGRYFLLNHEFQAIRTVTTNFTFLFSNYNFLRSISVIRKVSMKFINFFNIIEIKLFKSKVYLMRNIFI